MKIESQALQTYSDITFKPSIFLPLVEWMLSNMQGEVVIFDNGSVLLTEPHRGDLPQIIEQMARHVISPQQFFIANPALIKELLDSMSGFQEALEDDDWDNEENYKGLTAAQTDLRNLVGEALKKRVSDIHLEIRKNRAQIRFRRYGALYLHREWLSKRALRLCFVAFNRESDDVKKHFNMVMPHDASMELTVDHRQVRVRLASVPVYPYPSVDVVFRLLTVDDDKVVGLADLGYTNEQQKILNIGMARKNGAIIFAGATGSGKTTTLAALIDQIPVEKKVYTIEDPVEKKLDNATQIPTNSENPLCTFPMLVRQTLRMDPDCIVLGEVRDETTAGMMARSAITGHLVLSTLHANSAINIILRLKDLGLDINMLTDPNFLSLICFQVLLRVLCDACKIVDDTPSYRKFFETEIYAKGQDPRCGVCGGVGLVGRSVAAEVIPIGQREFQYIRENLSFEWLQDLNKRQESIKYRVLDCIRAGKVSIEDAESAIGYIDELHTEEEA